MMLEEKLRELNVYDIDIEDIIDICQDALKKQKNEILDLIIAWDENTDKQGLYIVVDLMPGPTWED